MATLIATTDNPITTALAGLDGLRLDDPAGNVLLGVAVQLLRQAEQIACWNSYAHAANRRTLGRALRRRHTARKDVGAAPHRCRGAATASSSS